MAFRFSLALTFLQIFCVTSNAGSSSSIETSPVLGRRATPRQLREPGLHYYGREAAGQSEPMGNYHVFQGALPLVHSSSSSRLSRNVSIGFQKPVC